jgi:membrane protein
MKQRLQETMISVSRLGGWRLRVLRQALAAFTESRASQGAAALAYYAFFSLFPLLLLIIAGGSFFLDSQQVYRTVLELFQRVIPISNQLITENLSRVLQSRGAVGIVGFLTLLWSASGFFTKLAYNVNIAWPPGSRRNFLEKRLVGLAMIGGLTGLLLLSLVLDWISTLIPILGTGASPSVGYGLWNLTSGLASWLALLLLFLALYRWIPTSEVGWRPALWGAVTASVGWKIAAAAFTWYLGSGLGRHQLVYGSLGAVVALLFLLYVIAAIALFGAHLSSAFGRREMSPEL